MAKNNMYDMEQVMYIHDADGGIEGLVDARKRVPNDELREALEALAEPLEKVREIVSKIREEEFDGEYY